MRVPPLFLGISKLEYCVDGFNTYSKYVSDEALMPKSRASSGFVRTARRASIFFILGTELKEMMAYGHSYANGGTVKCRQVS